MVLEVVTGLICVTALGFAAIRISHRDDSALHQDQAAENSKPLVFGKDRK